jgi:hypothetical protein
MLEELILWEVQRLVLIVVAPKEHVDKSIGSNLAGNNVSLDFLIGGVTLPFEFLAVHVSTHESFAKLLGASSGLQKGKELEVNQPKLSITYLTCDHLSHEARLLPESE